jgi:hypothetical protein
MDYKHTIDILSENIKELDEIVSGFKALERIPELDLDLVLDKTRNLYEVLLLLKKSVITHHPENEVPKNKTETASPSEHELLSKEDKTEKASTEDTDMIELETSRPKESKLPAGDSDEKKDKPDEAPKILSDRFKKQTTLLNEEITQAKPVYNISSRLQTKPISNIQNAIGLNDKFLFINELFDGDADKYNATIETLNNATNFNEAYNFLVENFQWDMDSELVQKILDLIRRKLIVRKDE